MNHTTWEQWLESRPHYKPAPQRDIDIALTYKADARPYYRTNIRSSADEYSV